MRDRFDPLIHERAPWLLQKGFGRGLARKFLDHALSYNKTLALAEEFDPIPVSEIMDRLGVLLAKDVEISGLHNVPRHGPAMIVSNHPTGIGDGIMLWYALRQIRPDLFIYANADLMRILPQFGDIIAPVEWRLEKRSLAKTRETMAYTRKAITEEGRLGIIFPSGRLAKRRGLRLYEREWMPSAAMIARKFDVPVIPLNIRARNSVLFYLFDMIHPTLRDITLFHETLNKDRQPFRITIGEPINPKALPERSEEAIEVLKAETLALGGRYAPTVSLWDMTRIKWRRRIA